jgi:hypothetical protein
MTTAKVIVWTPVKVITTLALFVFAGLAGKVLLTTPLCIFLQYKISSFCISPGYWERPFAFVYFWACCLLLW